MHTTGAWCEHGSNALNDWGQHLGPLKVVQAVHDKCTKNSGKIINIFAGLACCQRSLKHR